jgi:hypothetical protein
MACFVYAFILLYIIIGTGFVMFRLILVYFFLLRQLVHVCAHGKDWCSECGESRAVLVWYVVDIVFLRYCTW